MLVNVSGICLHIYIFGLLNVKLNLINAAMEAVMGSKTKWHSKFKFEEKEWIESSG